MSKFARLREPWLSFRQMLTSTRVGFVVILAFASLYIAKALTYRLGPMSSPGPGLFPVMAGAAVVVGAAITIARTPRLTGPGAGLERRPSTQRTADTRNLSESGAWSRTNWKRLMLCVGALVVFLAGVIGLGFLIPAVVLDCTFAIVGGPKRLWVAVAVGVLVPVATVAIFSQWLNVSLPGSAILNF